MRPSKYDINRFLVPQATMIGHALRELEAGRKQSHWMWFIFPQLRGLGFSESSDYYGIAGRAEAADYLAHPVLGLRLTECTNAVLAHRCRTAGAIFGGTDALKFHSAMTLFSAVSSAGAPFKQAIDHFYRGEED